MSPRIAAASTTTASAPNNPRKAEPSSPSSFFSLKCGCSNAKSVSVSLPRARGSRRPAGPAAAAASLSGRHHPHAFSARFESSSGDTITLTTATTSTSHDEEEVEDDGNGSSSFSGLLMELSELERSVIAWDHRRQIPSGWRNTNETGETGEGEDTRRRPHDAAGDKAGGGKPRKDHRQWRQKHRRHRRSQSEGGYGGGDVVGRMGGSVVVVTETEDPLGEFRRSMLQMIVEEDIVCPEELQELLRRFLALNSPSHHDLIVQAFADIWRDVFSDDLDDFPYLIPPASGHPHRRHLQRQYPHQGHRCY
ncbi:hypothetical protein Taro_018808 [Colocasia esculenta]|uniref:Transcription repressor n=1 Tax=Colocasia esculenta TaxID=4460 RepID=A0A843US19_COLES|nr:hypothetical protein [Colocasia esculenta]